MSIKNKVGISVYNLKFEKNKIEENPIRIEDIIAVFLLESSFAIRYVKKMIARLKIVVNILPKKTGSSFTFQIMPRINGHITGLKGSQSPCFANENMYFPIPM